MIECEGIVASKATVARLPVYLRYLKDKRADGVENVSSTSIAEALRLNPVQVRKDLALVSPTPGTPKLGFAVDELIGSIESFFGCDNVNDAILVGAGGLGSTLLSYEGFKNYGLNIVAAFDVDERLVGKALGGVPVLSLDKLPGALERLKIRLGILTVPKSAAQSCADLMVKSGIRAIWNFAPTHLTVPERVAVKNEDLAASLAVLSRTLSDLLKEEETPDDNQSVN